MKKGEQALKIVKEAYEDAEESGKKYNKGDALNYYA